MPCLGLAAPLILAEAPEHLGLAGKVWDSALVLIAQLAADSIADSPGPFSVRGLRVLELGAGTGAVGLACAALAAREVLLTDLPAVVPLLRLNASLSAFARAGLAPLSAAPLPWGTSSAALDGEPSTFEAVVLSDVVYDTALHEPLIATLRAVADRSTSILLAQRLRFSHDHNFLELASLSFAVERVEPSPCVLAELGLVCRNVELYRLRKL